jgi:K+ transporter
MLGYMGQAAYLMENHADASQAFFSSVPGSAFWPVLFIANIAALIASRTMTTATFSCIKQSTALGCFPRLKIIHTSRKFMGQIYIPVLNWFLLAVCLVVVCSISSIDEIGNAYGMAELGVMMTTTILVTLIMLLIWQINIVIVFFLNKIRITNKNGFAKASSHWAAFAPDHRRLSSKCRWTCLPAVEQTKPGKFP